MSLHPTSSKQRGPPSSLFAQPSPANSHVSLPGILTAGAIVSEPSSQPVRQRPARGSSFVGESEGARQERAAPARAVTTVRSTDRTDALWAEMQATLEEVELSASGGSHVFGQAHDRKLADLRRAQIALAQAWARSEADDAMETALHRNAGNSSTGETKSTAADKADRSRPGGGTLAGAETGKNTAASSLQGDDKNGAGIERLGAHLEEKTEGDILLARKRREANDEYFRRVNGGVLDVVDKLGAVAEAMRTVEQESKDIWKDGGSTIEAQD